MEFTIIEAINKAETKKDDGSIQRGALSGDPIASRKYSFSRRRIDSQPVAVFVVNNSSYFVNVVVNRISSGVIVEPSGEQRRLPSIRVNGRNRISTGPLLAK
jgi:hypothetical protein